jgi:hypothetical protein
VHRDSEVRTFHPIVTRADKMLPDTIGSHLHMLPLSPNHEACRSQNRPVKHHYRSYLDGRNSSRTILRSRQTNIWNQRLQVLRDEGRPFPLGWDKTIGWMDSRVKK